MKDSAPVEGSILKAAALRVY